MNAKINEILSATAYFRGLAARHIAALSDICVAVKAKKKETIFLEGQAGTHVYLLVSGAVQLVKTSEEGREIVIRTIEPGEVFAEVVLLERDTYPVTAVALAAGRLYAIPREAFRGLLKDPDFCTDFMRSLMHRLRYLAGRILELTSYDVDERFFRFLEAQFGRREHYRLPLIKKDIAAAVGTTPESLSRLILRLTNEGVLAWAGRDLTLRAGFWSTRG